MIGLPKQSRRQTEVLSFSDAELLESPETRRAFEEEILLGKVRKEISACLAEQNLRRRDLAQRLGVSEGRISQMLSGAENLTLKTLAGLALALDARFDLALQDLHQERPEHGQLAGCEAAFLTGPAWESRDPCAAVAHDRKRQGKRDATV